MYGDYPPKPEGTSDGGADFLQNLAERLVARGFVVTVVVSRREDRRASYVTEAGVRIVPLVEDWSLRGAMRGQLASLRRTLKEVKADVVHLIYPDPYLRYGGDSYHLPFLLKLAGAKRLVTTFFGFGVTGASVVTKFGLLVLFASTDRVVITDLALATRFKRVMPFWAGKARSGSVGSIGSGTSDKWTASTLARRQAEIGTVGGERVLGFFGFWTPDKGLEDLLAAMGRLVASRENVRLLLIGGRETAHRTDYETRIRNLVVELGIQGSVKETGPLPPEEVARYLLALDVCVLPFRANPLGRSSLATALTLGVPTIVSRPTEGEELLPGFVFVDPGDATGIATAIRSVLADPALQAELGRAAATASIYWSWDAVVDAYAADYERVG